MTAGGREFQVGGPHKNDHLTRQ